VNVIGSPEVSGQAVQPEFHCSAFSRNETLAVVGSFYFIFHSLLSIVIIDFMK
jgi:hypothetical protein